MRHVLFFLSFSLVISCQQDQAPANSALFEPLTAEQTKVHFTNELRESPNRNVLTYEYYYNGAGLAIADFNNDQLPDLYLISNLAPNQLLLNQGNFSFVDATAISNTAGSKGFDTGVTVTDINQDGKLDIYLCRSGRFTNPDRRRNELFVNLGIDKAGIPRFKEAAAEYGLDLEYHSSQASFFDYDKDGDLDLFLINHGIDTYADEEIGRLQQQEGGLAGMKLLRNEDNLFTDVTESSGIIDNALGFGLGLAVGDLNNDSWPDVYVSIDYSGKDHLYINQQDGTFREMINELTNHISFYSMGNDIGDINNDGWQDIINLDMVANDNYGIKTSMSAMNPAQFDRLTSLGLHHQYMYNTLLLSNGLVGQSKAPHFSDIGQLAGISSTDWSWAPLLFDFDNDGHNDIFISNGIKRNIRNNDAVKKVEKMALLVDQTEGEVDKSAYFREALQIFPYHRKANYFFLNNRDLTFTNITEKMGLDTLFTASNGAAYADLDLDGDLDLVVNNVDAPATILRNNSRERAAGNYIQIALQGPAKNSIGIGAKVTVKCDQTEQNKELYTSRGYFSAVEPLLHFGLGKESLIQQVIVLWPDGKQQTLDNVKVNQRLTLQYSEASETATATQQKEQPPLFKDITARGAFYHRHIENEFDDFARESLLPHKMSQMGPAVAVGDVNGDSLEDYFIGGAKGQVASLYLQGKNGTFASQQEQIWQKEKHFEDVTALLFDADLDDDLDLIVGSGSNEAPANSSFYQVRFYENDGNGNFAKNEAALPPIRISAGTIAAGDFDGDKDLDLFIGGRQSPAAYPLPSDSYLLRNESEAGSSKFVDITSSSAPFLENFGMVTDAAWVDINADNQLDLVTCGEWMAPRIMINQNGIFTDQTEVAGLPKQVGWWFALNVQDFDQDGDMDLVAGNLGLNYKYKSSLEAPFSIYANDFDASGTIDIVLGYHSENTLYPLRGRECSSNQMPFIKRKFPDYESFGKATLLEVYGQESIQAATNYAATTFATSYFENLGNGVFQVKHLPNQAQVSSVNAILSKDFDGDGFLDLLIGGNLYNSEVETPRNDASVGLFLKGMGDGNFEAVPSHKSGLSIKGEVRDMRFLNLENKETPAILVTKNNDLLQVLEYTTN